MVLQFYLWIFFYFALAGSISYGIYRAGRKLLGRNQHLIHHLKGRLNARRLKARSEIRAEEICSFCDRPTDPERDAYEAKTGWYHASCHQKLIESDRLLKGKS